MGFVTIEGRARRFAKIAGEMVSLGRVESELAALWPDAASVAITQPDERKGEALVVLTEKKDATREQVQAHLRERGLPDLYAPRRVLVVGAIPLLGTGQGGITRRRRRWRRRLNPDRQSCEGRNPGRVG